MNEPQKQDIKEISELLQKELEELKTRDPKEYIELLKKITKKIDNIVSVLQKP